MQGFRNTDAIRAGWEIYKKRPWLFAGAILATWAVSWFVSAVGDQLDPDSIVVFLFSLVGFLINILIGMGVTAFFLRAHDAPDSVGLRDLWHPQHFVSYLLTAIVYGVGVAVGFVLLIVPGVFLMLTYQFAQYFVIDKGIRPIEALQASARITRGHRWELFGLFIFVLGINILGFLFFLVGLLVSVPVTALAIVRAYRTLQQLAPAA